MITIPLPVLINLTLFSDRNRHDYFFRIPSARVSFIIILRYFTGWQMTRFALCSLLLLLCLSLSGGCFFVFHWSDDDNGFIITDEMIRGSIVAVIPSRQGGVENIGVVVTDERTGRDFFDITDTTGFFSVEGRFSGSAEVEFFDEEDEGNHLGSVILNVFPGARLRLGSIRLSSKTVVFENDIRVTFIADIIENNCTGNTGSLKVRAENRTSADVIVQISNSTDITDNGDGLPCGALFIGDEVRIEGFLLAGNNVEASRVELH